MPGAFWPGNPPKLGGRAYGGAPVPFISKAYHYVIGELKIRV